MITERLRRPGHTEHTPQKHEHFQISRRSDKHLISVFGKTLQRVFNIGWRLNEVAKTKTEQQLVRPM